LSGIPPNVRRRRRRRSSSPPPPVAANCISKPLRASADSPAETAPLPLNARSLGSTTRRDSRPETALDAAAAAEATTTWQMTDGGDNFSQLQ